MIVCRAPLRISFVGGGSDLPAFYRQNTGRVIATTINKYVYIALHSKYDGDIKLNYSNSELVENIDYIKHPLFKECLSHFKINSGVEIGSFADVPAHGSGLGSSSSFTVALLNALSCFTNNRTKKEEIARLACDIEINKCQSIIGRQDQYSASYGGLNVFEFYKDHRVKKRSIDLSTQELDYIFDHFLVFRVDGQRKASDILTEQTKNIFKNADNIKEITELVLPFEKALIDLDVPEMGKILNHNWNLKRQLASGITSANINQMYDVGIKNGAYGGKLLGAGGSGFMLFLAPKKLHPVIREKMNGCRELNVCPDFGGGQIVYDSGERYE